MTARRVIEARKAEEGQPLLLSVTAEGIVVSRAGRRPRRIRVPDQGGLLAAVAASVDPTRPPTGIVLAGRPRRFSESRSLAVVADTLAFAWRVRVAATVRPLGPGAKSAVLSRLLARAEGPVRPRYSGEPNITRPKSLEPRG